MSGNATYPRWIAKTYLIEADLSQIGTGAPGHFSGEATLFDESNTSLLVYKTGSSTHFGYSVFAKGFFRIETNREDATSLWQWYFDGSPQVDGGGPDGAWPFCKSLNNWVTASWGLGALPNLPGAVSYIAAPISIGPKGY